MIKKKQFSHLLLCAFLLTASSGYADIESVKTRLLETIHFSDETELPSDQIARPRLRLIWESLLYKGTFEMTGKDVDVRPYFVTLQSILEQVLAEQLQNDIVSFKGIIHTPFPATPLCTKGAISKNLVKPTEKHDTASLYTVKQRTTTLRNLLFKGGDMYIVYPKNGFGKRTSEQQHIYKQELNAHPKHLFDFPLQSENLPQDLIGATYFFKDKEGTSYAFSIKMTQANDPQESGHYILWFGSLENKAVKERVQTVLSYIEKNTGNAQDFNSVFKEFYQ